MDFKTFNHEFDFKFNRKTLKNPLDENVIGKDLLDYMYETQEGDSGIDLFIYVAREQFYSKLKEKFEVKEKKAKKKPVKTHIVLAGGNYTGEMILPYALKGLQEEFPFYSFTFDMAEYSSYEDIKNFTPDIVLSGYYDQTSSFQEFEEALKNTEFKDCGMFVEDETFLSCSVKNFKKFDKNIQKTLKESDILKSQFFTDSTGLKNLPGKYRMAPIGREKDMPVITTAKYHSNYEFMKKSLGLWIGITSLPSLKKDGIVLLEKIEEANMKRHVISKVFSSCIGSSIAQNLDKVLKERRKSYDKNYD